MLSIIINHYKSPEVLKLCLKYLKQNAPEDSELIVADSETVEKTENMMRYDFPEVKFLVEYKNVGFAKSVNNGVRSATREFLLIINADVIVSDKNEIPKMLEFLSKNPEVGMLGPRLLNINGEHQFSCFRFYSPKTILARRTPLGKMTWGTKELDRFLMKKEIAELTGRGLTPFAGSDPAQLKKPLFVDWIMGSAMLVRKSALEKVGLMSEGYFMYMEDVDWCRKFWESGFKVVYFPQSFFYHYHFQASKKRGPLLDLITNKYARIHFISAIKYFKKFGLKVPQYGV